MLRRWQGGRHHETGRRGSLSTRVAAHHRPPKAFTLVPVPELGVIFVDQRGPLVQAIIDVDRDDHRGAVYRITYTGTN